MRDFDHITDPEQRRVFDLPPLRRAGRPPVALAATLDEQLALLKPQEAQFVRHVLADKPHAEAYRLAYPTAGVRTSQVNGSRLAQRHGVAHAIRLGREQGAKQAVAGIKRDLTWADDMLDKKITAAEDLGQYTAVSSLVQQRLKLHGLLIDRAEIKQASLTVNIGGIDTSRLVNDPRVVNTPERDNE